ncbi:S8 family serine peptidase [Saccharopolyspora taberi]|uniref:S8 family serine peptidase n=1 Tax=Saccharopolyspora taberi TaxID=60895 RepID=UPI0031DFF7AF
MEYGKISPTLARAYDTYLESGWEGLSAHVDRHELAGVVAPSDETQPAHVVVNLLCSPDADLSGLADAGVSINEGGRRVRTATVPLPALEQLAEHPGVEWIGEDEHVELHLDVAAEKVGLGKYRTRAGTSGKGVIIGIVDTGIDSTHADFTGRVQRIWDQTVTGTGVPEGAYGKEYTGADVQTSQDTNGHGTMVAGVAAGAGSVYRGVAPEADLVVVKSKRKTSDVINGIRYLARVAREAKKPLVINLSLGCGQDPHDGTDALSRAVDEISGPGVVVCCSAGNEGSSPIRAEAEVGRGETTIPCNYGFYEKYGAFGVYGWYSGKVQIEIAFQAPSGARTPWQSVITSGKPYTSHKLDNWDVVLYHMVDPRNRCHYIGVSATPPQNAGKTRSFWKLVLRGKNFGMATTSHVDVWCTGDVYLAGPGARTTMTIAAPGAAYEAITVGAYMSRKKWTDLNELDWQHSDYTEDAMAPFSSRGPLRNGNAKPNVAAPGAVIVTCLSSKITQKPDSEDTPDSTHVVGRGTSMSAPFMAGVVALLLQKEPTLDRDKILEKLSVRPESDTKHDQNVWGRGLIDLDPM